MPFSGGITATANGTLLFSVIAALVYLAIVAHAPSPRRTLAKTLSTALLALLAWMEGGPELLVAALVLGSLGDAFLSRDGNRAFLGGLASFLAAHIAYVVLFWLDGGGIVALTGDPVRLIAAAALLAFGGFMAMRLAPAVEPALRHPVYVYIAAILAMGLAALTLGRPIVIVGAAMFVASDAILATDKFLLAPDSVHRRWTAHAVWSLYYAGQMAITIGLLLPS